MSVLKPAPVSSARFTWVPGDRLFVADASDLPRELFGRVYDDACDVGLTLVSAKTGEEIVFAVDREKRDGEGDLLYWTLAPADGRDRGFKVRIFND